MLLSDTRVSAVLLLWWCRQQLAKQHLWTVHVALTVSAEAVFGLVAVVTWG